MIRKERGCSQRGTGRDLAVSGCLNPALAGGAHGVAAGLFSGSSQPSLSFHGFIHVPRLVHRLLSQNVAIEMSVNMEFLTDMKRRSRRRRRRRGNTSIPPTGRSPKAHVPSRAQVISSDGSISASTSPEMRLHRSCRSYRSALATGLLFISYSLTTCLRAMLSTRPSSGLAGFSLL